MKVKDLNFTKPFTPPDAHNVGLNFGAEQSLVTPSTSVALRVVLSSPVGHVNALYSVNTPRPTVADFGLPWDKADVLNTEHYSDWAHAEVARKDSQLPWDEAKQCVADFGATHQVYTNSYRVETRSPWEEGAPRYSEGIGDAYNVLLEHRLDLRSPWEEAVQANADGGDAFIQLDPHHVFKHLRWDIAAPLSTYQRIVFGPARKLLWDRRIPWEIGRSPPPGREAPYVPPLPPVYPPNYNLNFRCKLKHYDHLHVPLNFGHDPCPGEGGSGIPSLPVYFIVNTISLHRVSDREPIDVLSASVGTDNSSWCWSFNATIPRAQIERVEPTDQGPTEVELEINGVLWRFLVEGYNGKEEFGKTEATISGRSVTAYLESPYAPVRSLVQSAPTTSRQLAENELTRAGLVTGFTLDWQLVDALGWQMPENTWSYTDLTPIQVVQAIAQGAGGFVNSHPLERQLLVLPDYPAPPWEWPTTAITKTIPRSLIRSQSMQWEEKPFYTGVYVSGENTGISAFVKRAGTDGSFQAQPVTSPMISDAAAARSRGLSILSSGGKQAQMGIELPMSKALGLVTPGMLIEVANQGFGAVPAWRGLVRSTSISAAWSEGLTVSQTLNLERHYGGPKWQS